jgi:toxin CptA
LSSESSSCRIDWRPSRLLCAAFAGLGTLAAIAISLSALPDGWRLALAGAALVRGFGLARREWNLPPCTLSFPLEGGEPVMRRCGREESMHAPRLALRGVFSALRWRDADGRARALRWAPDTLGKAARRALRLRFGGDPR